MVSQEDLARAKEMDLLTYLQNYEPQKLVKVSGDTYCTREHDSLRISNGKWNWFSHGIGGKTALNYLIMVEGYTLPRAVETILGRAANKPPVFYAQKPESGKRLLLPKANDSDYLVRVYLQDRCIDPAITDYCLTHQLLYESQDHHSAVFVGQDRCGIPRSANIRSTVNAYKGDCTGSDKRYSFSIPGRSNRVHVFESAIDLLSYATLQLRAGKDWCEDHLLSLAGVYVTTRPAVVPVALRRYLTDYPNVRELNLHLDNDLVGRGAAKGIMDGLSSSYTVKDEPPPHGKDVNGYLILKTFHKEDYCK